MSDVTASHITCEQALSDCEGLIVSVAKRFAHCNTPWLDLEDFIQEGRLCVLELLPSYDPQVGQLTTYVYRPMQRRFADMFSRRVGGRHDRHRVPHVLLEARAAHINASCRRPCTDHEIAAQLDELLSRLRGGVDELDWQLILLQYDDLDTYTSWAKRLGCTRTTVMRRARNAESRAVAAHHRRAA